MGTIRLLWRDADRLPHLYAVRRAAAAYGTEVELQRQGGQEYAELLFDGRAEMLAENYWNQQLNRAQGMPIAAVAAAVNSINERLYVRPGGIGNIAELRGKRIAVRDARPTNLIDPLWLRRAGLGDAEVVPDAGRGSGTLGDVEAGRGGRLRRGYRDEPVLGRRRGSGPRAARPWAVRVPRRAWCS